MKIRSLWLNSCINFSWKHFSINIAFCIFKGKFDNNFLNVLIEKHLKIELSKFSGNFASFWKIKVQKTPLFNSVLRFVFENAKTSVCGKKLIYEKPPSSLKTCSWCEKCESTSPKKLHMNPVKNKKQKRSTKKLPMTLFTHRLILLPITNHSTHLLVYSKYKIWPACLIFTPNTQNKISVIQLALERWIASLPNN